MKRLESSKRILISSLCIALVGFAVFASISAANLNFSTLQAIDGPVTSRQIEALRLSSALNATSVGIIVGVTFAGLAAMLFRRRRVRIADTASQSSPV